MQIILSALSNAFHFESVKQVNSGSAPRGHLTLFPVHVVHDCGEIRS